MTTMTAFEAKCAFGQFLDASLREPVTITQNGRNFGVMFAQHDLEAMALAFLSPAMLDRLRAGRISISEALLREAELAQLSAKEKAERRAALADPIAMRLAARRSIV